MENCVFCGIGSGTIAAHIVYEDSDHVAFLSLYPTTPGMTVVIPRQHAPSYCFDADPDVLAALLGATGTAASVLLARFPDAGRCAVIFEGFGVDHLHAKLIPLHGTAGPWEKRSIQRDEVYDTYPGFVVSYDGPEADARTLSELASGIRSGISRGSS